MLTNGPEVGKDQGLILKKTVGRETGSLSHLGLMVQTEHAQEKPGSTNTEGMGAM